VGMSIEKMHNSLCCAKISDEAKMLYVLLK